MPISVSDEVRLSYLRALFMDDKADYQWVNTLREYFDGKQPVHLTARQLEFIGLKSKDPLYPYAHNLCRLVVSAVIERLDVTGFIDKAEFDPASPPEPKPTEPDYDTEGNPLEPEQELPSIFSQILMEWWERNRMDAEEDNLYESACRDGEAYIIVDWNAEELVPRWTLNFKFDGTQGIKIHRDPDTNVVVYASKTWVTQDAERYGKLGLVRRTLYFTDRVEKYIQSTGPKSDFPFINMDMWTDAPGEPWPIPWEDEEKKPLGCAVIPFENPGSSELADIIPPQDMLNKSDLDAMASEDFSGFRILWVSGVSKEIDPTTGAEKLLPIVLGTILRMDNPAAKMGSVEPVDPSLIIGASKYWIETIAGLSRTPQYLFQALGAEQPSGESLRMQEVGLVAKVERKQKVFGNSWEDIAYMSLKLWNKWRPADKIDRVRLQTQWKDPRSQNQKELMETSKGKKELQVPLEQIWSELGYTPDQIADFMVKLKMAQEQERLNMAQLALESLRESDQGEEDTSSGNGDVNAAERANSR